MRHDDPAPIHHAAQAYTGAADTCVKGRPDYPPEVAAWLRDDVGLAAGATALDLGAGTGKFAGLGPFVERDFAQGHTGAPEDVILNRVRSTSFIAALPDDERARVDAQLRALIAGEPAPAGRPTVTVPYVTQAFVATKAPA